MNACLLLTLLTLVGASDDFNTNEIKKRMKLIGGIPSYGVQSAVPKIEDKSKGTVEYSEPKLDLRYNSTADFNPKGMGHLYTVSDALIKLIQPNKTLPEGFIEAAEKSIIVEYIKEKWPDWIKHYPGIFGILVLGLVLAGLMPIVGLIFWCCRCCGHCGGVVKYKKQNDSCKRTTLTLIFGGMAVLILFGVVCAFVTNEYMNESFRNVTTKISISLDDAQLYLNNTELETNTLLHQNFKELKSFLVQKFSEAGEIIKNELAKVSHANVLEMLSRLIEGMEVVKKDLSSIQSSTRKLQDLSTTLADYLDVTKEELLQELHNCRDIPGCRELLNHRHIAELKVVENFSELPDVSVTYFTVSELTGNPDSINSIQQKIQEGKQKFDDIKFEIADIVQKVFPRYESAFQEIEAKLNVLSEKIKSTIHEVRKHVSGTREPLTEVDYYTNKYGLYRYYTALATSGALLIILLCVTMGILYGVCGKRPDEMYSDDKDCCNTASGARFLMLCGTLLSEFLRSIKQNPSRVDFQGMINILAQHAQSQDDLLQFTAITWIKEFVQLSDNAMLPYTSGILIAILPCLSYEVDSKRNVKETAKAVNFSLMRLISEENDATASNDSLDLNSVTEVLTRFLMQTKVPTKVAVLKWIYHLHSKIPNRMFEHVEKLFPVLLKVLSDSSDEVVQQDLEVIAEIVSYQYNKGQGDLAMDKSASLESNKYFLEFINNLLRLFSTDRRLLEERGSFIIRQLCTLLNSEVIYLACSKVLSQEKNVKFISTMIDYLNTILLTSSELFELRNRLKDLSTKESCDLFKSLYFCWCHNPVATVALCFLSQNYAHACDLIRTFCHDLRHFHIPINKISGDLEVTVEFLTEIDKLVQLIESPIFAYLRLELLEIPYNQHLVQALYGLLMLLPQTEAFHTLRQRLDCIPSLHLYKNSSQNSRKDINQRESRFDFLQLLQHFLQVQEQHRKEKLTSRTINLLE